MQIDWITVSAQILNFLVLIWLLKRFLYEPVIRAMDRREQRIAERLNEAEQREQIAVDTAEQYRHKSTELEQERNDILAEARLAAETEKKEMLDQARTTAAEARAVWQRQAGQEKEEFLRRLGRQAAEGIEAIARKALSDLAGAELEEQIVHRFIDRLKALDRATRRALAESAGALRIVSTFELDPALRGRLTRAVHEHIAEGLQVDYSQSPELVCGIEITGGGRRLSWNVAHYLHELNTRIDEALSRKETATEAD
jgi:F-type H+-transporting ATPase subunit b